jgi:hypothetical protein
MTATKLPDGRILEHPDWMKVKIEALKGAGKARVCWLYAKPNDESFGSSVDVTRDKPSVASRRVEQAVAALMGEIESSRDGCGASRLGATPRIGRESRGYSRPPIAPASPAPRGAG